MPAQHAQQSIPSCRTHRPPCQHSTHRNPLQGIQPCQHSMRSRTSPPAGHIAPHASTARTASWHTAMPAQHAQQSIPSCRTHSPPCQHSIPLQDAQCTMPAQHAPHPPAGHTAHNASTACAAEHPLLQDTQPTMSAQHTQQSPAGQAAMPAQHATCCSCACVSRGSTSHRHCAMPAHHAQTTLQETQGNLSSCCTAAAPNPTHHNCAATPAAVPAAAVPVSPGAAPKIGSVPLQGRLSHRLSHRDSTKRPFLRKMGSMAYSGARGWCACGEGEVLAGRGWRLPWGGGRRGEGGG
jgi:hypothetical protein